MHSLATQDWRWPPNKPSEQANAASTNITDRALAEFGTIDSATTPALGLAQMAKHRFWQNNFAKINAYKNSLPQREKTVIDDRQNFRAGGVGGNVVRAHRIRGRWLHRLVRSIS
jgi:hypothetical protein